MRVATSTRVSVSKCKAFVELLFIIFFFKFIEIQGLLGEMREENFDEIDRVPIHLRPDYQV